MFTFKMSEKQARNIHTVVDSHCQSLKNWIASAVENDNLPRAKELTRELRQYQAIYAAFNITAKHEISQHTGKPLQTEINVGDN